MKLVFVHCTGNNATIFRRLSFDWACNLGVLWRLGIGQIWPVQRGGMAGRSLSSDREADELEHFGEQQYRSVFCRKIRAN